MNMRFRLKIFALLSFTLISLQSNAKDLISDMATQFADSEIQFQRADSNIPFLPLAYAEYKNYDDTKLTLENDESIIIDQTTYAQGGVLPILASPEDVLFVGEWINKSHISSNSPGFESFDVTQAAIPLGWLHQESPDTQIGGFIAPLGYKADLDGSGWSWQTLGGAFSRHTYSDDIWWAFGAYFDVGGIDDTYLPYLGVFWQVNEKLSVSAIMPWPAILYAPTKNTLFRFGAAPTGSSWKVNRDTTEINQELSGWDFGISAEHRAFKSLWFKVETGFGGLRALRVETNKVKAPDFKVDASSYIKIGINLRPSMN